MDGYSVPVVWVAVIPALDKQEIQAVCEQFGFTVTGSTVEGVLKGAEDNLQERLDAGDPWPEEIPPPFPVGTIYLVPFGLVERWGRKVAERQLDAAGWTAKAFVEAAHKVDLGTIWELLSAESKGALKGIVHVRYGQNLGDVHMESLNRTSKTLSSEVLSISVHVVSWGHLMMSAVPTPTVYTGIFDGTVGFLPNPNLGDIPRREGVDYPHEIPMHWENGNWKVNYLGMHTPASKAM